MSPEEHAHWWLREESCAECECDKPFSPPSCICARDLTNMFRSAQSQARDEALEEAAVCLDSYSSPTDVGEEMAHMFARRVRALKASKP
jgi:hypothetical protein